MKLSGARESLNLGGQLLVKRELLLVNLLAAVVDFLLALLAMHMLKVFKGLVVVERLCTLALLIESVVNLWCHALPA